MIFLFGLAAHGQEVLGPVVATQEQPLPPQAAPKSTPVTLDAKDPVLEFLFFFQHLVSLDAAAAEAEAKGNPYASEWRSHDQRAAGLTDEQGAILKQVAYGCDQILRENASGKRAVVGAAMDELRLRLGKAAFQTLASYVHATFGPGIEVVSGSPDPASAETVASGSVAEKALTTSEIVVNSHVTKLSGNQVQAVCNTNMMDNATIQSYPYASATCTLRIMDGPVTNVPCASPGQCQGIFPGAPGVTYYAQADHFLGLRLGTCNNTTNQLQDPLGYCSTSQLPIFGPSFTINPTGNPMCWANNGFGFCGLGGTVSTWATFVSISPTFLTLYPGQQQRFTANMNNAVWSFSGPGTLVPVSANTRLYTVPATVTSSQTASITVCDAAQPDDCNTATIQMGPYTVTLEPTSLEVLPLGEVTFTAKIPDTPGRQVEWSLSAAQGVSTGTITPKTDKPLEAVYKAPANDQISFVEDITIKVCGKADAASQAVCATAVATVPNMQIYVTAQKTTLLPGETVQLTAFAQGSSQQRELVWTKTPAMIDDALIVSGDTLQANFTASPFADGAATVDIKVCFKDSPTFCGAPLRLTIGGPAVTGVVGQWNAGTTTQFTITGKQFGNHPVVTFSSLPSPSVTYVSDTEIRGQVSIPVGMGGRTTQAGVTVTLANGDPATAFSSPLSIRAASLSVLPPTATLQAGASQQFVANCLSAAGGACNSEIIQWTASPGNIDQTGKYTAPPSVTANTNVTVKACWSGSTACATALVTVTPTLTVTVSPKTATVPTGQSLQFTVQVTNSANTAVTWSIQPSGPDAGGISQTGLYTAPATLGAVTTVTITATSQADATKKDTATITLVAPITVTSTASTPAAYHGTTLTWNATANGGVAASRQLALVRRRTGTTAWSTPVWQAGGTLTWTTTAADVGTWEIAVWVRDGNTPANPGYAATHNPGNVQIVAPPTITVTPSPESRPHDDPRLITWTATASGGLPGTLQYAFFRRRAGATDWTPSVNSPNWQTSNTYSWDPGAADVGTWDTYVWVKDSLTPASMNTYGYSGGYNSGQVTVTAPLCLSTTASPAYVNPGTTITWTATPCGGYPQTTEFAVVRRRTGTTPWSTPAWQSSNVLTWTPASTETGTWEIAIWVRDDDTPASPGYGASYNPGNVQVVAPPTVTSTRSPAASYHGTTLTWTATASGGVPGTYQFALVRRLVGTTTWVPNPLQWQTSNVLSWTPTAADAGTWELFIMVKDSITPANPGYAGSYNPGNVQIVAAPTLTVTPSPAWVNAGTAITWTATASGGVPGTYQYAFFRRRSGTTTWTPSVNTPNWQTSNSFTWNTTTADAGLWDIYVWLKDSATPPTMNTYGYAAGYNPGSVQVVLPLSVTSTASPAYATYGNTINWTASATGGVAASTQFALVRRRAGTTTWTTPVWQSSGALTWLPGSTDVGTWEISVWVRDGNTPASPGYAATYNPGNVQVLAPVTVSGTSSPAYATYGNTITWTANANGGVGPYQYAFFRRRSGTTPWMPDVSNPNWQTGNSFSWNPSSAEVGPWDIIIWVKDANTPANMNTYGYAAYYNAGGVEVIAPVTLTGTSSPSAAYYNTSISWTLTASGGVSSTRQYAFFRRRAGTTAWTPAVTSPAWQTSRTFNWTPTSADTGTWEIIFWVKDAATSPTQNSYGYSAYYNAGPVEVVAPMSLSVTGSPSSAFYGQTITWNANASGGTGTSVRYAFFRRRSGDTNWIPSVNSPNWQTSSSYSWTLTSADVGNWDTYVWVKDSATPATMNTYGYAAGFNTGGMQIVAPAPLTVSGTGSPSTSPAGTSISWSVSTSGGVPSTVRYALFRRRAGTSSWTPDVTSPSWQTSSTLRWTPSAADVGTWEIIIWVKDVNTSPTQNTYGFAAYYNAGPVTVY